MKEDIAPIQPAFVVGSAGHIDHGKTSLIRALTGIDLDVLPEEKERGITIALGFTHKQLPSGKRIAFVDVPGHERLIRTMIAGAVGIDAVLFCVSAAEGVMPQTREHLDILGLLGVEKGVVAITHADAVDSELAELAADEVKEALAGSFLEHSQIILTSSISGRGLEELEAALEALPAKKRDSSGPYRLPVDRVFVQKGFGAVVTGTSYSGEVCEGDELLLLPQDRRLRVRGIEVHGEGRKRAVAGERTALNLAGVDAQDIPRGSVLVTPKSTCATPILDVHYQQLPKAPTIENRARLRLLLGTTEVLAIADKISSGDSLQPGEKAWLQLRCETPVACLPGDRFILRRESPLQTLGGGQVTDPWAKRLRKKDKEALPGLLQRMKEGDSVAWVERAGPAGLSREEAVARIGEEVPGATWLGDRLLSDTQIEGLRGAMLSELDKAHTALPLSPGIPRRSLHKGLLLQLSISAFEALIEQMAETGEICMEGPRLRLPQWVVTLSPQDQSATEALLAQLKRAGLDPPQLSDIQFSSSDAEALVAFLVTDNRIYRIAGRLYSGEAIVRLKAEVKKLLAQEGELSPGRFKTLTGLSRKGAIPLLEFLDQEGLTKRVGDVRVAATSCSP